MKILAIIGAICLVSLNHVNADDQVATPEAKSLSKDVNDLTNELLSQTTNPTDLDALAFKAGAFIRIAPKYGVSFGTFSKTYQTIKYLTFIASNIPTAQNRCTYFLGNMQNRFDTIFDRLNVYREVDESKVSTQINDLIDNYFNNYTEILSDMMDNIYIQGEHLVEGAQNIAPASIELLDSLIAQLTKCIAIPSMKFKEIFECNQKVRLSLPELAHNTQMLALITEDLSRLYDYTTGDKKLSEMPEVLENEMKNLLLRIGEIKAKDQADAQESSEE